MDIRRLPASQGWVWFRQAIDLGARNPRAVLGAALLMIAALYAAVLLMVLVLALLVGGGKAVGQDAAVGVGAMMAVALPLTALVVLLVPILLGGLMHVVRETEAGRPARARDVFAPLHTPHGRRLAWLGVAQMVLTVIGGVLLMAIAGSDYWRDYLQAMQSAMQGATPTMPEPHHPGLLFLLQMGFNYFSYGLLLLAIPLMLFSGCHPGAALIAALRALVRNAAPNMLAGVLFIGALLVGALVAALGVALLATLGSMIHPVVGVVVTMLAILGFAAVVLVLVAGGAYLAWRDTFGEALAAAQSPHAFEA